jgi:NADH dehydrogenase/NADH:ubiquinone oxidoreductase subunit G
MGALTLKSFPFELRGWDIEKFESIDPTDSFGSNTRVYISQDQVILIEPDYNINTFNTWLTDKGRQFYDGIFGSWKNIKKTNLTESNSFIKILNSILKNIYLFDHCSKHYSKNYFFTIVFGNVSLEVLNLLIILENNYSFIKLKRAEKCNYNNDLEYNFQLNLASDRIKLNSSTLCLLLATNPRYEGYYLNLNLRQRFLKGNFKCLSIGSLVDLTFPISFLGSNIKILKSIVEGNNLICQDLKFANNPLIIYNNELLKRNDGNYLIKSFFYLNIFKTSWNGTNMLNSTLSETGFNTLTKVEHLTLKDLKNFSILYFLNVSSNNLSNLKKITDLNLLNYSLNLNEKKNKENFIFFLDQNNKLNCNFDLIEKLNQNKKNNYYYLPVSNFYENEETYINTEGYIKRTSKLIYKKKTRNNWQILRQLLKFLKQNLILLHKNTNNLIFFNSIKIINFKNFNNFKYYPTKTLTNLSFYLSIKNNPIIFNSYFSLKKVRNKIKNTKVKYWLDDFFSGGKDEYSHNSLSLTNCSKILRSESTNFF